MKVIDVIQGSESWLQHRAKHFNASDAPAMMGQSKYKSRNQLLQEMATGVVPDIDEPTARRFADGHTAEALARPLAERIIGEDLYPVTGYEGDYSASFDGLTIGEDIAFEHKALNDEIRACKSAADLHPMYRIQMEHQLMVSGAGKCLFMASAWNDDRLVEEFHFWYEPDMVLRAQIVKGWEQFKRDLAEFKPAEVLPPVTAAPVMALPAVSVQVKGSLAILDNFAAFEVALRDFIDHRLIREPETDQDFADLDLQIKALKNAETALDAAEAQMLAQVDTVDTAKRTKDMLYKLTRDNRLMAEKLLNAKKETIRFEIVQAGREALNAHCTALSKRIGKPYMPVIENDFAGVIKGKKTLASIRNACDTELARRKIEANAVADRIQLNIATLAEASQYQFLFADAAQVVLKAPEDLSALVKVRIAEHAAAEQQRLENEREKIRAEEQAKAQREADTKAAAERQAAEAKARQEREEQAVEDKRIAVELAEMETRLQSEMATKAKAQQAEADRIAGLQRAAEAERQKLLDTDQLLASLRERIEGQKAYAGVARAIDAYFGKQARKAA